MSVPASSRIRQAALLAALAATAVVTACGGGGSADAGATGASSITPTAFTQGTITGFGSIVVNGVRFDESAASVSDDAGNLSTAQALRLGMRVEVDHADVDAGASTARAAAVRYGSLVLGPVATVDAAGNTLTVLGQVVDVTPGTVFSETLAAGLSALAAGAVIEVHGLADAATGHITATRVEAAGSATRYKLRGTLAGLNTSAKTFNIGAAAISYAALASTAVPSTLADGVALRVDLATAQSGGFWVASALGVKGPRSDHANGLGGHVRGKITAFTSATRFTVDGVVVDAGTASFPDGSSGLALGPARCRLFRSRRPNRRRFPCLTHVPARPGRGPQDQWWWPTTNHRSAQCSGGHGAARVTCGHPPERAPCPAVASRPCGPG